MDVLSKEQMNHALLGMYVGTWGPTTLRKCITDKLFTNEMYGNGEKIRNSMDAEMTLLVFPAGKSPASLDELDDLVVKNIGAIVFGLSKNDSDISKLRNTIQGLLEGPIFNNYLESRREQSIKKNRNKKLLSKIQFAKLYPLGRASKLFDLDITVLCFILFAVMEFRPSSDFDKLPLESTTDEADDMLRIKICRNILVHQPVAEISDKDFESYWECLTGAFERLLKSPGFRRESEKLKKSRLPFEKVDQVKGMIQEWRMEDREERRKQAQQIIDTLSHTETVIKSTGIQIVENQNEKHKELVNLLKESTTKRRREQNRQLQKSFSICVYGHDKFQRLCHIMDEEGIKYTLPTASSSNDTTPNSDSSSSSKSSDTGTLQFEMDREDAVSRESPSLRRSRILPRSRTRHHNDIHLRSSADSTTNTNKVAGSRQERQQKRSLSEKSRNTDNNKSPRPESAVRTGVCMKALNGGKLTAFDGKSNPADADAEDESADDDPILLRDTERQKPGQSNQSVPFVRSKFRTSSTKHRRETPTTKKIDTCINREKADNSEVQPNPHPPEVKRLMQDSKPNRKMKSDFSNILRKLFCGGKGSKVDKDKSNQNQRKSECYFDAADISEPIAGIQLSESQRPYKGYHIDSSIEEDELTKIFVEISKYER